MAELYRFVDPNMSEVIPNLWLGDLRAAKNSGLLKQNNIRSIVTVMRRDFRIAETFKRYHIQIDDTEDEDILKHFVSAITFIQTELDKGHGVLVHCMAGISRSVAIVAAYLMYTRGLDPTEALELIREARPAADPNVSFVSQLEIFHKASYNVSKHDKDIRMFYLERMVKEIMNGDGKVDSEMLSNLTHAPSVSNLTTLNAPQRRIRCKMCRTELASREHMLDHGQLSPPTPVVSFSPTVTTPPGFSRVSPRSSSLLSEETTGNTEAKLTSEEVDVAEELGRRISQSLSLAEDRFTEYDKAAEYQDADGTTPPTIDVVDELPEQPSIVAVASSPNVRQPVVPPSNKSTASSPGLVHPSDLSATLYSNPKLAALRGTLAIPRSSSSPASSSLRVPTIPPILINPKCSGYFVEPLKWMEPFLEQGQLAGKIICPNQRCKVKLGNYDWAGVCCSCKEWVVPGFCIHRSKVDEII